MCIKVGCSRNQGNNHNPKTIIFITIPDFELQIYKCVKNVIYVDGDSTTNTKYNVSHVRALEICTHNITCYVVAGNAKIKLSILLQEGCLNVQQNKKNILQVATDRWYCRSYFWWLRRGTKKRWKNCFTVFTSGKFS